MLGITYESEEEESGTSRENTPVDVRRDGGIAASDDQKKNDDEMRTETSSEKGKRENGRGSIAAPPSVADCDPKLQEKISRFIAYAKQTGRTFNSNLVSKKDFGNPYLLSKIVDHFGINDVESNFPKEKFDPDSYPKTAFYDRIRWAPSTHSTHMRGKKVTKDSSNKRTTTDAPVAAAAASAKRSKWGHRSRGTAG